MLCVCCLCLPQLCYSKYQILYFYCRVHTHFLPKCDLNVRIMCNSSNFKTVTSPFFTFCFSGHTYRTVCSPAHTYILWPVSDPPVTFCGMSWVLGFDSRDPVAEIFIVRWTVKAPQKFHFFFFFLTQCNQRPNHTPNMLSMHVKLYLMGNYTIRNLQQSCGVLVWRLSCEFTGWSARLQVLSTARQGIQCIVCVCVHMLVFVWWSSTMPVHPIGVCLCGCVPAWVCVPMCAVRRKWLCLFKLSTLSHVGQFSGNENPAPHPLPSPFAKPAQFSSPHFTPKTFWMSGCLLKAEGLFGK